MSALSCEAVRELAAGFVLGALEPAEMVVVRDHLASCADTHAEFAELGGVVPYLADSLEPVEPSASLRGRILAAVATEAAAAAAGDTTVQATAPDPANTSVEASAPLAATAEREVNAPVRAIAAVVSISAERVRRRSPLGWVAAIAAVLIIAALGAWNVQLRSTADADAAYRDAVGHVLAIAGAPGGQAALLRAGSGAGPSGLAAVGPDGSIAIAMRGLAQTGASDVYEAWVIGADGVPVPVGSFRVDSAGLGTLIGAHGPNALGVTLALTHEPRPGMTSPTLPIISSGVASGGSQG